MNEKKHGSNPAVWPVAAVAFAAGPVTSYILETDKLSLGPGATLWPIAFVAAAAFAGLMTGLVVLQRGYRGPGIMVAIPNTPVLLFYGFLLLFFGLGGSR